MSLKVDDSKKKPNNFKFKLHYGNGNINSEDLHKYIHNLIKEKLDRVYERLVRLINDDELQFGYPDIVTLNAYQFYVYGW